MTCQCSSNLMITWQPYFDRQFFKILNFVFNENQLTFLLTFSFSRSIECFSIAFYFSSKWTIQDGGSKMAAGYRNYDIIPTWNDVIRSRCEFQRKHLWKYYVSSKFCGIKKIKQWGHFVPSPWFLKRLVHTCDISISINISTSIRMLQNIWLPVLFVAVI